jgi:hypothetical protein
VDAEGAEWDIFRSSGLQNVQRIRMEYHSAPGEEDLQNIALKLGSRLTRLAPHGRDFGIAWLDQSRATRPPGDLMEDY